MPRATACRSASTPPCLQTRSSSDTGPASTATHLARGGLAELEVGPRPSPALRPMSPSAPGEIDVPVTRAAPVQLMSPEPPINLVTDRGDAELVGDPPCDAGGIRGRQPEDDVAEAGTGGLADRDPGAAGLVVGDREVDRAGDRGGVAAAALPLPRSARARCTRCSTPPPVPARSALTWRPTRSCAGRKPLHRSGQRRALRRSSSSSSQDCADPCRSSRSPVSSSEE